MHAEKCPVCNGEGKIKTCEGTAVNEKPCHGCDGKGWVTIGNDYPSPAMPQTWPVYPMWPSPFYYTPSTTTWDLGYASPAPDYEIVLCAA